MALQSAVLGVGAYLVIQQQATAGIIIASSILTSRALAPVELAIANWRGFLSGAPELAAPVNELFGKLPDEDAPMALPAPTASSQVESLTSSPPGTARSWSQDASFTLSGRRRPRHHRAERVGKIVAGARHRRRLAAGARQDPARRRRRSINGRPRLSAAISATCRRTSSCSPAPIAQNIARFEPEPDSSAVIAAARAAGVHELILRLPEGYETQIGEARRRALGRPAPAHRARPRALSAIRSWWCSTSPTPTSTAEGEKALTAGDRVGVRQRGGDRHRGRAPADALCQGVDQVLVMANGRVQAFGPKDEVLRQVLRQPAARRQPTPAPIGLRVVSDNAGSIGMAKQRVRRAALHPPPCSLPASPFVVAAGGAASAAGP